MNILERFFKKENKTSLEKFWKIPELKELSDQPIIYESNEGLKIRITKTFYSAEEPLLTDKEKEIYELLKKGLFEIIYLDASKDKEETFDKLLRIIILELNLKINNASLTKISYNLKKEFLGFGKIEALLKDPLILQIQHQSEKDIVLIKHKIYGILKTDIILNIQETQDLIKKILIRYNKDILEEQSIICEDDKVKWSLFYSKNKSNIRLEKKYPIYLTPKELLLQKKISAEILTYLWMLISDKKNIFTNDKTIINILTFFLPAHSIIKFDSKYLSPNELTKTIIGKSLEKRDYSFYFNENSTKELNGTISYFSNLISDSENIIVYSQDGKIVNIKENGQELFTLKDNQFLFSLKESKVLSNLEEFKRRTKLITILANNNLKDLDFKKIIAAYYESPDLVCKKAGIQ